MTLATILQQLLHGQAREHICNFRIHVSHIALKSFSSLLIFLHAHLLTYHLYSTSYADGFVIYYILWNRDGGIESPWAVSTAEILLR